MCRFSHCSRDDGSHRQRKRFPQSMETAPHSGMDSTELPVCGNGVRPGFTVDPDIMQIWPGGLDIHDCGNGPAIVECRSNTES